MVAAGMCATEGGIVGCVLAAPGADVSGAVEFGTSAVAAAALGGTGTGAARGGAAGLVAMTGG